MKSLGPRIMTGVVVAFLALVGARAADTALQQTFQSALVAEEARRDLPAAIRGYEEVIVQVDAQRSLAATAVFRLGECYRKMGRTNDAVAQYQRLLRDYGREETLAQLSRENLAALGAEAGNPGVSSAPGVRLEGDEPDEEQREIARLRTLFDRSPDRLNDPVVVQTPLFVAAEKGQLAVVKALLSWGANPNRLPGVNTPLHVAAVNGHKAVVEALLDGKADPDAIAEGQTPLSVAVARGFPAVVEAFLSRGVKPGAVVGDPALFAAAQSGFTNLIERLVRAGSDVNVKRPVRANPSSQIESCDSPIGVAILSGRRDAVRTLIRLGAAISLQEKGPALLPYAIRRMKSDPDDSAWFSELLGAVPKTDLNPRRLDELLHQVVRMPKAESVIPLLLTLGASVESRNSEGHAPLHVAVLDGSAEMLQRILEARPNVNATNRYGYSALHIAAQKASPSSVELLLAAGADPNCLGPGDETPLSILRDRLAQGGRSPTREGQMVDATANLQQIESLLLKAGARAELQRQMSVHAQRDNAVLPVARRGGANPPPKLADVLLWILGDSDGAQGRPSQFNWPDFGAVRIRRLLGSTSQETVLSLPVKGFEGEDCVWNIPLEWGDIVEVPKLDHPIGSPWGGINDIPEDVLKAVGRCSERRVRLVIKNEITELRLLPALVKAGGAPRLRSPRPGVAPAAAGQGIVLPSGLSTNSGVRPSGVTAEKTVPSVRLGEVLKQSGLLRVSSDLKRVRVVRGGSGDGSVLDVADDPVAKEFWLLDGDVITVPEREAAGVAP